MAKEIAYPDSRRCCALRAGRIYRFFTGLYDNALSAHQLSSTQLNILMAVREQNNITGSDLIQHLHLDRSTVSKQLRTLTDRKLVKLYEHMDRRYKLVELTDDGRRHLHAAAAPWQRVQSQLVDVFGDELSALTPLSTRISAYRSPMVVRSRMRPENWFDWHE